MNDSRERKEEMVEQSDFIAQRRTHRIEQVLRLHRLDCSVKAISVALQMGQAQVRKILKANGRLS